MAWSGCVKFGWLTWMAWADLAGCLAFTGSLTELAAVPRVSLLTYLVGAGSTLPGRPGRLGMLRPLAGYGDAMDKPGSQPRHPEDR